MQSNSDLLNKSLLQNFVDMYQKEGLLGLYRVKKNYF